MLTPKHPYYSANDFFREKFNTKLIKIALDGGFTCPNRDGNLSDKGCIFCSEKGSGDFAGKRGESIALQLEKGKQLLENKWGSGLYMAYFQSFTNTYGDLSYLEKIYYEAVECEGVAALSVATRPDCINEDIVKLLAEISKKVYVCVELGLQTVKEESIAFINRCYDNRVYIRAAEMLKKYNIDIVTHTIIGLPGEKFNDYMNTVSFAVKYGTKGLKLQLLHILEGTELKKYYDRHPFYIFDKEAYVKTIVDIIERIPQDIVIHRLTGDGPKDILFAPRFTLDKRGVLNSIHKEFIKRGTYQGFYYN